MTEWLLSSLTRLDLTKKKENMYSYSDISSNGECYLIKVIFLDSNFE